MEPEVPATTHLFCTELLVRPLTLLEQRVQQRAPVEIPIPQTCHARERICIITVADVLELQPAFEVVGPHSFQNK